MRQRMIIACTAALVIMLIVQSAAAQGKWEGVWKPTEVTLTGPNARTITTVQPGLVIVTKNHYSIVAISGEKPRPDLPQKATDAQKVATWTPFAANAGTYEVKGTTVTQRPIVAKDPFPSGFFITSEFKIEGNTLTITPKATQNGPIANPYTMKLVRVE